MSQWQQTQRILAGRSVLRGVILAGAAALGGCTVDSYMDPSVLGRWEATPTTVPILERIAAIEVGDNSHVETSQILAEDLIPEVEAYRLGPGDQLEVRVRDLFQLNREEQFFVIVDARGFINIQRLPAIKASGRTVDELRDAIVETIRQEQIKENAVVSVQVAAQRQQTFHALGGVGGPGSYLIPEPDYRLLEALTAAGGFNESVSTIYIIRQIPLSDEAAGRGAEIPEARPGPEEPAGAEELIDLIDELVKPEDDGAPAVMRPRFAGQPDDAPVIDLPDSPPDAQAEERRGEASAWKFLNGRWVKVLERPGARAGGPREERAGPVLVTQRVIEVPVKPLLAGAAEYNLVVRPGDIIRVPAPTSGLFFVVGQVARPGTFNMPASGQMTLLRAIDSAGGLSQIAVPERCDLTRMIGPARQGMIRLNLRAIAEGRQPDIFIKPDDRINVGTDFWAFPLAVMRNGFRFSYGFGFLLDRNFGNDVFGPPPSNDGFN